MAGPGRHWGLQRWQTRKQPPPPHRPDPARCGDPHPTGGQTPVPAGRAGGGGGGSPIPLPAAHHHGSGETPPWGQGEPGGPPRDQGRSSASRGWGCAPRGGEGDPHGRGGGRHPPGGETPAPPAPPPAERARTRRSRAPRAQPGRVPSPSPSPPTTFLQLPGDGVSAAAAPLRVAVQLVVGGGAAPDLHRAEPTATSPAQSGPAVPAPIYRVAPSARTCPGASHRHRDRGRGRCRGRAGAGRGRRGRELPAPPRSAAGVDIGSLRLAARPGSFGDAVPHQGVLEGCSPPGTPGPGSPLGDAWGPTGTILLSPGDPSGQSCSALGCRCSWAPGPTPRPPACGRRAGTGVPTDGGERWL